MKIVVNLPSLSMGQTVPPLTDIDTSPSVVFTYVTEFFAMY